ncbi:MAG: PTS sugar transporter subunit IIA [Deltaproteobacteria bacterium]|nr:MAG: PTS sugar transporter subunit IIA [Deltaproteobacteria bacterium]
MKITELMNKYLIIPQLSTKTKKEVLKELVDCIVRKEKEVESNELLRVLLEREELGSTGIGDGIAIPHGKVKKIKKLIVSFGRSIEGVDFQSMDGKPTHLIFLLIAPENSAGIHLKALARISRLLKDGRFRKNLMEANTPQEIYDLIAQEDEKY